MASYTAPNYNTRWTDRKHIEEDASRIVEVTGGLPRNHLLESIGIYASFRAWMVSVLRPETYDAVIDDPAAYGSCFNAYINVAKAEARALKNRA